MSDELQCVIQNAYQKSLQNGNIQDSKTPLIEALMEGDNISLGHIVPQRSEITESDLIWDDEGQLEDIQDPDNSIDDAIIEEAVFILFDQIDKACDAGFLQPREKTLLVCYYSTEGDFQSMTEILRSLEGNSRLTERIVKRRWASLAKWIRECSMLKEYRKNYIE